MLIVRSLASDTPILGHMAGILNANGWLYRKVWTVLWAIAPSRIPMEPCNWRFGFNWYPERQLCYAVLDYSSSARILCHPGRQSLFLAAIQLLIPSRYQTIQYHTIALAHRIPNCFFPDSKLASGKEQDASKWEPGLWSEPKTLKIHNN
jgi:hypothetical protein